MSVPGSRSYPTDGLDANRSGILSDAQRRGFGALAGSNRRSALSTAALLAAGGLLVAFFASRTAPLATRVLVPLVAFAIAAVLVARSTTGSDALTRDVEEGRVDSVEGAIGKRRFSSGGGGRSVTTRFLDVGDQRFNVSPMTFEAAPDAGKVRLYYLPRSRKVVNLEPLENAPPADLSPKGLLGLLGAAIASPTLREENEARATIAGLGAEMAKSFTTSPGAPPADARDPRALDRLLVGTWSNRLVTVTFSRDGSFSARLPFGEKHGRWSVDRGGHLQAELDGHSGPLEAWIAGDELTIVLDGNGVKLRRTDRA